MFDEESKGNRPCAALPCPLGERSAVESRPGISLRKPPAAELGYSRVTEEV